LQSSWTDGREAGAGWDAARTLVDEVCRADADLAELNPRARRLAFWVNLYNMTVAEAASSAPSGDQAWDFRDFSCRREVQVGGYDLSLDDIENGILRGNRRAPLRPWRWFRRWDARSRLRVLPADPRVVFILFRGSLSGPPLRFLDPERLEAQLYQASVDFVNHGGVVLDSASATLTLSPIFRRHAADFGGDQGVMKFIAAHLDSPEEAAQLLSKIGTLDIVFQRDDGTKPKAKL
jgi:hypothetical protein